jgi:hypothetical protein
VVADRGLHGSVAAYEPYERETYLQGRTIPHGRIRREPGPRGNERNLMALSTILLLVILLMLVGALPAWPYSRNWGYMPSGGLGLVLVIIIALVLMNRV